MNMLNLDILPSRIGSICLDYFMERNVFHICVVTFIGTLFLFATVPLYVYARFVDPFSASWNRVLFSALGPSEQCRGEIWHVKDPV